MKHFKFYTKEDILSLTTIRRFQTKLGERIQYLKPGIALQEALQSSTASYVVLGIPEDIGIKADFGTGGADTTWVPFLSSFLNVQSNDFLTGEEILLLGHFDFGDIKYLIENNADQQVERIDAYRHAVSLIDEEVEDMLKIIATCKKVPIVIGGGHNNAYPLIKGVAKGLHKTDTIPLAQISCINLDAHADYGATEGRHSGNGFRYAEEDGYLGKYCIIGLHENYLPQNVLTDIHENPFVDYISYEDLCVHEKKNMAQAVAHAVNFTDDGFTGVEVDLDSIAHTLTSNSSPVGFTALQARQYINQVAAGKNIAYMHVCEGATQLADDRRDESTGKLISYLVSDFIKSNGQ